MEYIYLTFRLKYLGILLVLTNDTERIVRLLTLTNKIATRRRALR